MQKYYIRDFLTKELEKNDGKLTQYYVENDHEAIIEREIWDAAQLEINRIKEFKRNHQIRELGSSSLEPFYGKIFCGCCGGRMVKKSRKSVWRCINSGKEKGGFCKAKPVEWHKMEEYVSAAWAQLVSQREKYAKRAKAEREAALTKARDLAKNPGNYIRATSYGAAKYVKK